MEAQAEARHAAIVAHHAGEKHRNFEAFREMQMELALYRMQTQAAEAKAQMEHQAMLSQARSSEAHEVYQTCVGRESAALVQLECAVRQKNLAWEERVEDTERSCRPNCGSTSATTQRAFRRDSAPRLRYINSRNGSSTT